MCPTGQDFGIGRQEPQPKDSGASVYSVEINHKRDRRFESGCFSDVKSTACFFGPEAIDGFSETERDDHFSTTNFERRQVEINHALRDFAQAPYFDLEFDV